jgi:uncharacterized protein YjiS (DUF1127 family)
MDLFKLLKYAKAFQKAASLSSDVLELIQEMNKNGVRYVIIGGEAMERCKLRNSCRDIDIFVEKSPENSRRIFKSLAEFGYPVRGMEITPETFSDVGSPAMNAALPGHVEIIVNIKEMPVTFEQAYRFSEEDNGIRWLSAQGLANLKGHKNIKERRERDRIDVELLEGIGISPEEIEEEESTKVAMVW